MRILKIIYSFIIACFISSCDNTPDNEINTEPFPPSNVNVVQNFSYKNNNGDNLLLNDVYKESLLSLICTDENYNDLYINGELVADRENIIEIRYKSDDFLTLFFGRPFSYDDENNSAIGYYKLKYDEDKYDTMTVHFYNSLKNGTHHYITKIIYNGVEYPYSELPIEIIKEE